LDGTLIDPVEGITNGICFALNYFDIEPPEIEGLYKFIGPPIRDSFRDFYNMSEEDAETAVAKYREYFEDKGVYENFLYEGILELLEGLKAKEIKMALATSKPSYYAEKILVNLGIRDYFEMVAGCELDGTRSHKNELIAYAQEVTGHKNNNSQIMIGDRKYDIIGAKQIGIDSIGVTWGYGSAAELSAENPSKIADTPKDLYNIIMEL
jgi:phosphoglycolate phosphatase